MADMLKDPSQKEKLEAMAAAMSGGIKREL